jgi:lipopolysaccharide cholinephosphotransferase
MTIAQKFIDKNIEYKDYDFKRRKLQRSEFLDKKTATKNLLLMNSIFKEKNLKFTLLFGTLLGAVREHDFISYDTDTDIGIFEEDREKLLQIIPIILENGFSIIRTKEPDDLVTFMKDDEYIDVGIFRLIKRKLKEYYTYQGHLIPRAFLDDLDKIEFLGKEFNVPKNKELYLTKTYGSGWKTPRKNEPALNTGFLNIYYRLRRAFIRTKAGTLTKKLIGRKS